MIEDDRVKVRGGGETSTIVNYSGIVGGLFSNRSQRLND